MTGITQPNVYPDQFSGGEGRSIYRSPLMRGRGPAPSGIGQGLENIAAALMPPNPATQALAEDRMAQAELRKAQLAKATADLTASQQARTESRDPIKSNSMAMYGDTLGPLVEAFVKNGGVAPSAPETADQPGLMGGYAMDRPAGFTPERERELRGVVTSGRLPGKTTFEQLQKGLLEQQTGGYRGAIAGEPTEGMDPAKVAAGFYATSGKAPFTEGTHGDTFSPLTGKADASGAIPQSYIATQKATAANQQSQVPLHQAQAQAARAQSALFAPGASAPSGEAPKTGADFLATLNPQVQPLVQGIAEGRINPASLSTKGGHREQILSLVSQYKPAFNQAKFPQYAATMKNFAQGPIGANITNIDQALQHANTLDELFTAQQNNDLPAVNAVVNRIRQQFGDPAVTTPQLATLAVGDEMMRTFRGSGAASEQEAQRFAQQFSTNSSPAQQHGAVKTAADLLAKRMAAINSQWQRGMDTDENYPGFQKLTSLPLLAKFGASQSFTGSGAPTTAPTVSAPPANLLREGQETSFKNGQTWTLRNGQPVKVR